MTPSSITKPDVKSSTQTLSKTWQMHKQKQHFFLTLAVRKWNWRRTLSQSALHHEQVELRFASVMANQLLSATLKPVHLHTMTNWQFFNGAGSTVLRLVSLTTKCQAFRAVRNKIYRIPKTNPHIPDVDEVSFEVQLLFRTTGNSLSLCFSCKWVKAIYFNCSNL